uniref:Uncharacterized protein n=1 Tax=Setaria viridis TaxID=4556 RepID=A0A4U6UDG2_SETVI|nr:hypothetical protein SEVIR_5G132516v2 [Setaria viridis]
MELFSRLALFFSWLELTKPPHCFCRWVVWFPSAHAPCRLRSNVDLGPDQPFDHICNYISNVENSSF